MHHQLDTIQCRFVADSGAHSTRKCAVSSKPYKLSKYFLYAIEPDLSGLSNYGTKNTRCVEDISRKTIMFENFCSLAGFLVPPGVNLINYPKYKNTGV